MSDRHPLPEVHLTSLAYTAYHWLENWRGTDNYPNGMFDLDAPYQRGSVWSDEQRRNLIKSLVMGLPVGTIIVSVLPYRKSGAAFRIVDGKQRIEALRAFFADELSVPADWFTRDDCPKDGDVMFSELSEPARRGLQNRQMSALEFKADLEWLENPDYDPTIDTRQAANRNDVRTRRYLTRDRTDEEILKAEAELYLLVNFGGVDQTDDDRLRAAMVAGGGS